MLILAVAVRQWWLGILLAGLMGLGGCDWGRREPEAVTPVEAEVEGAVVFRNLVLRQSNTQGELIWKIQAESATYSPDRRVAHLKNVQGELLDGGKAVYKLIAPQAQVQQQETQIILQGSINVEDLRQDIVLTGEEFIWQPEQRQLQARKNPKVRYPQVELTAKQINANSQTQVVTAQENVRVLSQRADFKDLELNSRFLRWDVERETLVAGSQTNAKLRGVEIKRIKGPNAGERATGGELAWDLAEKTLTLRNNAQVKLVDPDVQVASDNLIWQTVAQVIRSPDPVRILSPSQSLTAQAQQGFMNLAEERVELTGQVQINRSRNPAQLRSDRLIWQLAKQEINALGNVFYQQQSPFLRVQGSRAVGWLDKEEVIVSGGVRSQIIPRP